MEVTLISCTSIENILIAALTCTDSLDKLYQYKQNPEKLIEKLLQQGHESVIEHVNYTFSINKITRALLQQLSRHRHISLSVQSTRWALHKVLNVPKDKYIELYHIPENLTDVFENAYKENINRQLSIIKDYCKEFGNDIVKYMLPECFYTSLIMTVNARELRHIFNLRVKPPALKEFNDFVLNIYEELPDSHQFMFKEFIE